MKSIILLGFLIWSFNSELTRQSNDVLKMDRIYVEAHRCVIEGQKNHNTKEAILNAIDKGVEAIETDVQLTKDKKLVLIHDFSLGIYKCEDIFPIYLPLISKAHDFTYEQIKKCKTIEGDYNIPLLDDIMSITKGKIFMNLEIKEENEEIWDYIKDLIEKHEYFNQISISGFNHTFYEKVEKYNNEYNRSIVFGFLYGYFLNDKKKIFSGINKRNHQISINAQFIKDNPEIVEKAHNEGMTVGLWFFSDIKKEPTNYNDIFDLGIDVIITDYPIRVAEQLKKYFADKLGVDNSVNTDYEPNLLLEGCKSVEKNNKNFLSCKSCKNGYELVYRVEQDRNLCKLKYEIIPDLYIRNEQGIYYERNIFAIKMLMSPIENEKLCRKNGKTILYFEWLFDLYGYDYDSYYSHLETRKYIIDKDQTKYSNIYSLLSEEHIKKLNFNEIQIYIDDNLIDPDDFICIDLYSTTYYSIYSVMGAHCYILYNGEQKDSYSGKFILFDDNYLSFVTYDGKFLISKDSWSKSERIYFYDSSESDSLCDQIKDPFQERISCFENINNCIYCQNENTCKKCKDEFTLVDGKCFPLLDFINNLEYFTPDNGINYYTCSSKINKCKECSYDYYSFNNFHCSNCLNKYNLDETFECSNNKESEDFEKKGIQSEEALNFSSAKFNIIPFISYSLILLIIKFI